MRSADSKTGKRDAAAQLSHVDAAGRPAMVDIGAKAVTARTATAECRVAFPPEVAQALRRDALRVAKGGVVETAIIAGTMAVKATSTLIPFCHPLPIHACKFAIDWGAADELLIRCSVETEHRTGVEMEALTGATVAALTVYDMCKALSHEIVLREARLVAKRGGRRDVGGASGA
jgi:cyclic pyranopterin phosphate synthase